MTTNQIAAVRTAAMGAAAAGGPPTRPCTPPALPLELRQRVGRIIECLDRPQLTPREPGLTWNERRALVAALTAYRAYLKPGAARKISALVTRLRAHYFVPDVPDSLARALADDWADDLAIYPLWAVDEACRRYRRTQAARAPRPADIMVLADEEIEIERRMSGEIETVLSLSPDDVAEGEPPTPACAVWNAHRDDLIADFGAEAYGGWLRLCIPETDVDGVLTLAVPTAFFRDHIEAEFKDGLQKVLGRKVVIVQRPWASDANTAQRYREIVAEERAAKKAGRPNRYGVTT